MVLKLISGALILLTAFLNLKHAWAGLTNHMSAGEVQMMADIGIGKNWFMPIGVVSLAIGVLVLFPQTFFAGNVINAIVILFIMVMALKAGVIKTALIEIPFLLMPLILIYLGHPLRSLS